MPHNLKKNALNLMYLLEQVTPYNPEKLKLAKIRASELESRLEGLRAENTRLRELLKTVHSIATDGILLADR